MPPGRLPDTACDSIDWAWPSMAWNAAPFNSSNKPMV